MSDVQPEPDSKDWTWTIEQPCADCGFDAGSVTTDRLAPMVLELTAPWPDVLARPDVRERPDPQTWSPLEYGCHVRDVCEIFTGRVELMLAEQDPPFPNWDQDAAAIEGRYAQQDQGVVTTALEGTSRRLHDVLAGVCDDQWQRTGRRSNGSVFTVHTLGRYCLHEFAHHLWDVGAVRPDGAGVRT